MLGLCFLLAAWIEPVPSKPTPPPAESMQDAAAQLANVKRIFVDLLDGNQSSLTIRDMIIGALQRSKMFMITENEENADAVLKGSGEDTVFTLAYSSSEGLTARSQIGTGSGGETRTSTRNTAGLSIGENESRRDEERKHEAIATVRLVSKSGDVLWSTTQESTGAKFLGASADVADKITRALAADLRSARHGPALPPPK